MYRSKQQGLCTIWNLCTKSQAKAYKGDQSVTSPPFAIPREEQILQTSCRPRHAVWTMILIGHGTHTAQASAILAQETSVSTTSERAFCFISEGLRGRQQPYVSPPCELSEQVNSVWQCEAAGFPFVLPPVYWAILDNSTCLLHICFPRYKKLAVMTQT